MMFHMKTVAIHHFEFVKTFNKKVKSVTALCQKCQNCFTTSFIALEANNFDFEFFYLMLLLSSIPRISLSITFHVQLQLFSFQLVMLVMVCSYFYLMIKSRFVSVLPVQFDKITCKNIKHNTVRKLKFQFTWDLIASLQQSQKQFSWWVAFDMIHSAEIYCETSANT